ncbi:hypothetical protein GCM10009087_11760 [Sphingomonas oligophenolica]|uniref:Peptidase M4 n=1 Tax=Sphingomonas oligophenolica TaxID=301154 RepID=A0ABU9Y451_9SPHN
MPRIPCPSSRRLRIFALDPSLGSSLRTYDSRIATVSVPFEELGKGPVGEYLEVVDVDPASNRYYLPVDLNHPYLLAQDGLDPSEGNPGFHQQMVYAVAMRTIAVFEEALGRKALWAPTVPTIHDGRPNEFIRRLRLYPHATRAANAYYSPDRRAILFGYFPSEAEESAATPGGTMVFACLSGDIIAHEMTHALLDGAARGFRESSNPDVLAFHEGFADIVALFQHFGYRDLVLREIAAARGTTGAAGLLSGLARQFGEGASRGGPLRDYVNFPPDLSYATTFDVHDRGALLVKAVYDAFLLIVERRTGDLIRLATGGSGILRPGALHPDLVERLTDETCRAARHVLRMCIRAIDYCPSVDITFGSYLRALITSDLEQVDEDRFAYRMAFLESFRHLGLLPRNLRTVSIETLRWRSPRGSKLRASAQWVQDVVDALHIDWRTSFTRKEIFEKGEERRDVVQKLLKDRISREPDIAAELGLKLKLPKYNDDFSPDESWVERNKDYPNATNFEVSSVRAAQRLRPNSQSREEIVIVLNQRRPMPIDPGRPKAQRFWFRGGVTLIINPRGAGNKAEILYAITRSMLDKERLRRERAFRSNPAGSGLSALYLADPQLSKMEPFAMLHRREEMAHD